MLDYSMQEIITIKPHHFIDIIKLYGAGITVFVPDEIMGHNFYKIGNQILNDKETKLKLTIKEDDICLPCQVFDGKKCTDALSHIPGFTLKNTYNSTLDQRIISILSLDTTTIYTARNLCSLIKEQSSIIFKVWKEEANDITKPRYELFNKGANQYVI